MFLCFFLMIRRPPRSTLFPYTAALPIPVEQVVAAAVIAESVAAIPGGARRRVRPRRSSVDVEALVGAVRSEEHTSELQSRQYLVCRLLLEKKKKEKSKCLAEEKQ